MRGAVFFLRPEGNGYKVRLQQAEVLRRKRSKKVPPPIFPSWRRGRHSWLAPGQPAARASGQRPNSETPRPRHLDRVGALQTKKKRGIPVNQPGGPQFL